MKTKKDYARHIRAISNRDPKQHVCTCCGTTEKVQRHHLFKVTDLADICYYKDYDPEGLYIPCSELCDEEHKLFHQLMGDNNIYDRADIDLETALRLVNLLDTELDFTQVPEELVEDYDRLFTNMIERCEFEIEQILLEQKWEVEDDYEV